MKRLNSIPYCGLVTIITATIILGAFSLTFAQKGNGFSTFGAAFAQNESAAKDNLLTPDFTFIAGKYLKPETSEYPKPDFSGIEKWYEVVRWEYGDFEGGKNELDFWLKMKNDARPDFTAVYYDKDDVMIGGARWACFCEGSCYVNAPVGTVQKWSAGAPSETDMKKVATVKVVRNAN